MFVCVTFLSFVSGGGGWGVLVLTRSVTVMTSSLDGRCPWLSFVSHIVVGDYNVALTYSRGNPTLSTLIDPTVERTWW